MTGRLVSHARAINSLIDSTIPENNINYKPYLTKNRLFNCLRDNFVLNGSEMCIVQSPLT